MHTLKIQLSSEQMMKLYKKIKVDDTFGEHKRARNKDVQEK
jgi:hypothetical protein